jgi:hypothetical protein
VTAQGEDLLAWLKHAISMHEDAALKALSGSAQFALRRGEWVYVPGVDEIRDVDEAATTHAKFVEDGAGNHIAVHDPASVLRRCAADRKLMALHRPVVLRGGGGSRYFETTTVCKSCEPPQQFPETAYPCPTLRALAEGYGWTEGER